MADDSTRPRDAGGYARVREALKHHARPGALVEVDFIAGRTRCSPKTASPPLGQPPFSQGGSKRRGTD